MDEHPMIYFRDGISGRRPALLGTRLDVADVIETIRQNDRSVERTATYLELPADRIEACLRYYADYGDEIDEWIDRRRVANPIQARTLLHAVGQQRGGRRLVAFFGCLYYAALRPEEAISLASRTCRSPRGAGASCTSNAPSPTPAKSGPTAAATATSARSSSAPVGKSVWCPARPR